MPNFLACIRIYKEIIYKVSCPALLLFNCIIVMLEHVFFFSELILLLRKLHEAFIAIAAQLQQVHEAVKVCLPLRKPALGICENTVSSQ